MTDFRGKTSIFSHPVYLFLRKFSLQDSRGGSRIRCHLSQAQSFWPPNASGSFSLCIMAKLKLSI
ncbi:hypothetical protein CUB84_10175 [Escherichia coli]|nr:hypothetical protein CUB84_10175 [Escherichia coli]